jgi:hypothetical protein
LWWLFSDLVFIEYEAGEINALWAKKHYQGISGFIGKLTGNALFFILKRKDENRC